MGRRLLYITNGIAGAGGLERVLSVRTRLLAERYGDEKMCIRDRGTAVPFLPAFWPGGEIVPPHPAVPALSPCQGQIIHALLTRPPLEHKPKSMSPLDLHVLGTPPAFVLSQNQTLMFNSIARCSLKHLALALSKN